MTDVKHVCNINVGDRFKCMLMAGTPFLKEQLVLHTFETLKGQGHITEYSAGAPVQVVGKAKGKALASIPNSTPEAAINPPRISQEQKEENARNASIAAKEAKESRAIKKAEKVNESVEKASADLAEEVDAQEALAKAEAEDATPEPPAEDAKPESTVQQIWTADPEKIKGMKYEQLNSIYRTQCEEYALPLEQFNSKKLLIAKLSSQFKA